MTEQQKQLVRQWILKAENDLLNVTNNLDAEHTPWDTVCFHCQQAVEKYIKAVLVVQEHEIPRTHDLEQIYSLIRSWIPELDAQRDELRWLTSYSVLGRYPVEVEDTPAAVVKKQTETRAMSLFVFGFFCITTDFEVSYRPPYYK